MNHTVPIFISSKQSEFTVERAVLADKITCMPPLEPVLAEDWPPASQAVRDNMIERVRLAPIFVGIFGDLYSEATELEYRAAAENPYREILLYIRRNPIHQREERLSELIAELQSAHVTSTFDDLRDLLPRFQEHLRSALVRMVSRLRTLGESGPETRGALKGRNAAREHLAAMGFGSLSRAEFQTLRATLEKWL